MRIPVPLPVRPKSRAYGGASEEEIHEAIHSAHKTRVPVALLRALQHTVGADRLSQYESDPRTKPNGGSPIVIERGGKLYIRNGHHRATAAIRRGDRTLLARVAHLGEQEPRRFREHGNAGDLLMIDPRAMQATYRQRDVEDVAEIVDGGIAVMCIEGPLESKAGSSWWCWFDDYESILERFKSAIESEDVRAVLLKIDSPGGSAAGLNECVDAMLRLKVTSGKPVVAYADEGVYSAAYALACVADEIYLPRAGGVGSIGVISSLCDITKMNEKDGVRVEVVTSGARKADFNPNVPITGAAIARVQSRVDGLAKLYWELVKETRGVSAKKLEADTFYGPDAVKRGLADGVMSLEDVLASLSGTLDNGTLPRSSSLAHGTRASAHGPRGTKRDDMSNILALTADVKAATAKLATASSRKKPAAEAALALAEAALSKELAKVTKDKKTITTVHESESESESESSSSSSGSSSSDSESESEAESYESEEKEILALARQITGKSSTREVLGALAALGESAITAPKAAKELAKLTAERASRKVDDLIAAGKASHKITPGNEAKARKIAAKHGHRALAAFIDAAMPAIDGREATEAEEVGGGMHVTDEQRKIWVKMGYGEKDFPVLIEAMQKEAARLNKGLLPVRSGGS